MGSPLHVLTEEITKKFDSVDDYVLVFPEGNEYGVVSRTNVNMLRTQYDNGHSAETDENQILCVSNFTGTLGLLECGVGFSFMLLLFIIHPTVSLKLLKIFRKIERHG